MIRTFVAVELPADLKRAIEQLQEQLKRKLLRELPSEARLQWVRPEAIHLTLKFLSEIEEPRVDEIRQVLAQRIGAVQEFFAEAGGLGVFPDLQAPRVLWLGLSNLSDQPNALVHLAGEVESGLETLGFPREPRPFNPHLTLARIKERSREVGRALAGSGVMAMASRLGSLPVTTVSLMKSELRPSGAVYTKLWDLSLGSASACS
ncbi:MAG: RNA 2',3'-cyclic phosphodiesterase [Nitrospirae bacterium]|nr:RNA 2',3'-cyclic phosphodiesterase [Nitrospirota bacterium]